MVMKWKTTAGMRCIFAILVVSIGQIACGAEEMPASTVPQKPVPRLVVQTGHAGQVTSIAFSPDGKMLISGSEDNTVKLWDVASGREVRSFGGQAGQIFAVAFSPDGKIVASGSWDETIKLWDAATGQELYTLKADGRVMSLSFSPDGHTLASGTDNSNKEVSGARTHRVTIWEVVSGKPLHFLDGHKGGVRSLAFSPDGRSLVSAGLDDTLRVWDTSSGNELKKYSAQAGGLTSMVYLPNSHNVAIAGLDHTIRIWDLLNEKERHVLKGHAGGVHSLSVSRDGKVITSISSDQTIKIWNSITGEAISTIDVPGFLNSDGSIRELGSDSNILALSPDGYTVSWGEGELIAVRSHGVVRRFDSNVEEISLVQYFNHQIDMHAYSGFLSLWDSDSGNVFKRLLQDELPLRDADDSFSWFADKKVAAFWGGQSESILIVHDETVGANVNLPMGCTNAVAVSPDGKIAAAAGGCSKGFLLGEDGKLTEDLQRKSDSRDPSRITLWDSISGRELRTLSICNPASRVMSTIKAITFSPDSQFVAFGGYGGTICLGDVRTGQEVRLVERKAENPNRTSFVLSLAFSPDGKTIVVGTSDHFLELLDAASGRVLNRLDGHNAEVNSVSFSPDGKQVISASADKSTRIWRASDGILLATLYSFTDGSWVVTDPEGRFDTADLEEIKGLHWVMPDDPLTPVPLEAFMKDYYEPRLLPRILNGEKFKPVRALMELNRVQPQVKIVKVTTDNKDLERAVVEVEVSGAQKDYERDGRKIPMVTAANDLRLFRDGQLVGYVDGQVVKQGDKPYHKTFNVHLPSIMSGKDITFSAYAFNDDRVKSATVRQAYQVPASVVVKKGNAYLVSIGVNRFDNPAWNLRFAANDARLMRKSLSEKIQKTGAFKNVIPVSMISDEDEQHADKALLHALLDRLSGKHASPLLKELPGAEQLQPATPDDLVLITFSGHGYADGSGNFYLLTQDTGKGEGKQVDANLLKRSISSEELSQWLKDVDAGDMTLIVDACQSAASVEGRDFKPGPMGSRGLGQLSFDKGMRILAASQADEYALEDEQIKQGLLSFALLTNGIEAFEADLAPKDGKIMLDEWLRYGVSRVPSLAEEVKTGKVHVVNRGGRRSVVLVSATGIGKPRPAQQPALFDFAKKRRQVEVAGQ